MENKMEYYCNAEQPFGYCDGCGNCGKRTAKHFCSACCTSYTTEYNIRNIGQAETTQCPNCGKVYSGKVIDFDNI